MPAIPRARREPRAIEQLGRVRHDDYGWMKDDNWQAVLRDPGILRADIAEHLRAENTYSDAIMARTIPLQEEILAEMTGRMSKAETFPALPHGPWRYFVRYAEGAQHPIYARHRSGFPGQEEILLDVDANAKAHDYYAIGGTAHSADHALFAFAEDSQGSEVYRIWIRNCETAEMIGPPIESTSGNFAFSPDARYLFWTLRDEHGRPTSIYRRTIGTSDDQLVYRESDPGFFVGITPTRSGKWLVITANDHDTSEAWLIAGDAPLADPICVAQREKGVMYDLAHWSDRFIIRTNADGAVDFKLVEALDGAPGRAGWRDIVAHSPGHYITASTCFAGHLVWLERSNANTAIRIRDRAGETHTLNVDEEAYTLSLDGSYEFDTSELRYSYQSPTTPRQWLSYDMQSRTRHLLKEQELPSGHDPADYRCQRVFARAPDGEEVPITLLMRHDTAVNAAAPLLLYGYGSYGHSIDPTFSTRTLSLVDRGWIYAIAHIRGGSEKGWNWFLGGRGPTKPNSFTDFIACATHLIERGYTRAGRIVADGRSAGGMLMGAITNMRPDLFAGIVSVVPFVDVLNTMSDITLPLTPPEWPEWGNPLEDRVAYDLIASYSPYDNITAQPYPAVLAIGGLSDPRVTYWEPAKWIARLRNYSTSGRPLLLRTNMEAGHGGASGRFDSLKEAALIQAFAIWALSP